MKEIYGEAIDIMNSNNLPLNCILCVNTRSRVDQLSRKNKYIHNPTEQISLLKYYILTRYRPKT